jgi:mRNA interferase HicA
VSDTKQVKGSEFLRKVKEIADKTGTKMTLVPQRGKGSHSTLYFGDKRTIVCNIKSELKKGTLHGMLKQLGIDPQDF